jgi:hypothetical protein
LEVLFIYEKKSSTVGGHIYVGRFLRRLRFLSGGAGH